ncbi:MAG: hypothetical protein ACOCUH_03390 [Bacteriovoracia bacterium]
MKIGISVIFFLLLTNITFARSFCEGTYKIKIKHVTTSKSKKIIKGKFKVLTSSDGLFCEISTKNGFFSTECASSCNKEQIHLKIYTDALKELVYSLAKDKSDATDTLDRFNFELKQDHIYIYKFNKPWYKLRYPKKIDPEKYPVKLRVELENPDEIKEALHMYLNSKGKFKIYH